MEMLGQEHHDQVALPLIVISRPIDQASDASELRNGWILDISFMIELLEAKIDNPRFTEDRSVRALWHRYRSEQLSLRAS